MVLFGGLKPIPERLIIDSITLLGLGWSTLTPIRLETSDHVKYTHPFCSNSVTLVLTCCFAYLTSGITNRWPITYPMIPLVVLQIIRRYVATHKHWIQHNLRILIKSPRTRICLKMIIFESFWFLSLALLILAITMAILFPAVELPPVDGPYDVGVFDFFLPVHDTNNDSFHHLPVRLLYPAERNIAEKRDHHDDVPYLLPHLADDFCEHTARNGGFGEGSGWLLHNWKLISRIPGASYNVPLLEAAAAERPFPLVIHSHGILGASSSYSYQTNALASHGYVVLSVTHMDGSSPAVDQPNPENTLLYDYDIVQLFLQDKKEDYNIQRRLRNDLRVEEVIAVTEFAKEELSKYDPQDPNSNSLLAGLSSSFVDRVNVDETFIMGHSFGGATALTAAYRRPGMYKAILAHEPYIHWMSDDARMSLLDPEALEGIEHNYTHDKEGFIDQDDPRYFAEPPNPNSNPQCETDSIHDQTIFILNSQEWREKRIGLHDLFEEMYRIGTLGSDKSLHEYVEGASHVAFADTCMLVPTWLSRMIQLCGRNNPIDSAKEIADRTRNFLESIRQDEAPLNCPATY